jgi:hypothetical protein
MEVPNMKRLILACAIEFSAQISFGQTGSAIQFYDSTGSKPTVKFGWTGEQADGQFYVKDQNNPQKGMTLKGGNMQVDGSVTASSFSGDASGLSNVPAAIQNNSIAPAQINSTGATNGQALMYNGTAPAWQTLPSSSGGGGITGVNGTSGVDRKSVV